RGRWGRILAVPSALRMRLRYRSAALFILLGALAACADAPSTPLVGACRHARRADTVDRSRRPYTFPAYRTLTLLLLRPPPSDTVFHATCTLEHDSLLTRADDRGSEQFVARVRGDTLVLSTPEMTSTLVRVAE